MYINTSPLLDICLSNASIFSHKGVTFHSFNDIFQRLDVFNIYEDQLIFHFMDL